MSEPFLGEIRILPTNFAPYGWAMCNGQILAITQNTALFSLLGTYYGGDGKSTFALPDFQGRVPIHQGQGLGLSPYQLGQTAGSTAVTLLQTQLTQHSHNLNADSDTATRTSPGGNLPAVPTTGPRHPNQLYSTTAASTPMLANSALPTGGSQPHNNVQPYLALNFCIALQGIYPARG